MRQVEEAKGSPAPLLALALDEDAALEVSPARSATFSPLPARFGVLVRGPPTDAVLAGGWAGVCWCMTCAAHACMGRWQAGSWVQHSQPYWSFAGTQGRRIGGRGKAATETEEREFRRRAAALNIRISPYFKRTRPA